MKKTIWSLILIVCLVCIYFVFKNDNNTEESYSIGVVVPLSGGAANIGSPFVKGMTLAVENINAKGGINGRSLILGVEDGEFSGTKSISAANKLLSTINPDVFDVLFALPAQALSPVFKQAEKPFLEWDYSRDVIKENNFAFKTGFDAKQGCADFVKYAKERGMYKKLGILMSRTPYNQSCFEGIKEVETDVNEYWYEFGTDDFKTLAAKINDDEVDTVVSIFIDPEPIQVFKQINDFKYKFKLMCFTSSECIYDGVKKVASPEILKGTLASDFIPEGLYTSDFAKSFKEKYPNDASNASVTWAAQGYDDVLMMAEAMKECEPKDGECLVKSLNKIRDYNSPINSKGFTNNIQNLILRKQIYNGNSWVDLK